MYIALITLLVCLFFFSFPQIDLFVSSLFYHNGFYLKNTLFATTIYKLTIIIIATFAIGLIGLFLYEFVSKKEYVQKRVLVYLLLSLILGPGLIVNVVLKNHFGRARPSQIKAFGGTKKFTPAGVIASQCQKNCSFTSGHAAAAFYFLSLLPLIKRRKALFATIIILWGSLVGFVRIVQGGHFLSDVVCSALIVYLVAKILYYLLFERKKDETLSSYSGNE